jgi:hypothetical protein
MRRVLIVVLVMLAASAASAQWYMGIGVAGTAGMELDFWGDGYRNIFQSGDNDGVIDNTVMTFGYGLEAMDLELTLGYGSMTAEYTYDESRAGWEETYSRYTLGLGGFYHMLQTDNFTLDGGLRFKLMSDKYEYTEDYSRDWTEEIKLSGWAVGPALRGRVWMADGALSFGPEVAFNYSSMTLSDEVTVSRDEDELDLSSMSIDYALNLYWHF